MWDLIPSIAIFTGIVKSLDETFTGIDCVSAGVVFFIIRATRTKKILLPSLQLRAGWNLV
jgi:hypothetical protein